MRIAAWLISRFNDLKHGQKLGVKLASIVFLITEIFLWLVAPPACIAIFAILLGISTLFLIVALLYGGYDDWLEEWIMKQ